MKFQFILYNFQFSNRWVSWKFHVTFPMIFCFCRAMRLIVLLFNKILVKIYNNLCSDFSIRNKRCWFPFTPFVVRGSCFSYGIYLDILVFNITSISHERTRVIQRVRQFDYLATQKSITPIRLGFVRAL